MEEVVKCPSCKKRIFDLEWKDRTVVKIKCQHCRSVETIERDCEEKQKKKAV